MNFLFTIADLSPESGGPARAVSSLCCELARLGHRVEVVCWESRPGRSAPLLPDDRLVRSTVVALRRGITANRSFLRELEQRLGELKPDLACDNGIWSATNHVVARFAGIHALPRIVAVHGMLRSWALRRKRLKKILGWIAYQRRDLNQARCLVATSEDESGEILGLGLRPPVATIPLGVEIRPRRIPRNGASRRTVLFLGRLVPNKGLLDLVDAWARLRPVGWQAVIAGPDEFGHGKEVRARTRANGIAGDFVFLEAVDEITKWRVLEDADLFVLPTHGENFGLAIAEALAAGVPVLTTKCAPWPQVAARDCGWWIDRGVDSLVSALREALESSSARLAEMGLRGQDLVRESFGWTGVAARFCKLSEWATHGGRMPDFVQSRP